MLGTWELTVMFLSRRLVAEASDRLKDWQGAVTEKVRPFMWCPRLLVWT